MFWQRSSREVRPSAPLCGSRRRKPSFCWRIHEQRWTRRWENRLKTWNHFNMQAVWTHRARLIRSVVLLQIRSCQDGCYCVGENDLMRSVLKTERNVRRLLSRIAFQNTEIVYLVFVHHNSCPVCEMMSQKSALDYSYSSVMTIAIIIMCHTSCICFFIATTWQTMQYILNTVLYSENRWVFFTITQGISQGIFASWPLIVLEIFILYWNPWQEKRILHNGCLKCNRFTVNMAKMCHFI